MQIDLVISKNVAERWGFLEPEVLRVTQKACHGEYTADDARRLIELGLMYGAYAHEGGRVLMVCLWEMVFYPQFTSVNVACLGGRDVAGCWKRYGETMRAIWKAQGATAVECSCSKAMARLLEKSGFIAKPTYIVMRGEL